MIRNLTKLNGERLHARLALSEGRIEISSNEQQLLLRDLNAQLEENNKQIQAGNAVTKRISEALRLDWVRQLGSDLKTFMRKIFFINVATYKAIMDLRRCLPGHLERSLYQEPFILEDAIGRIAPVHMQFISSWEAFDSVLELRFQSMSYPQIQSLPPRIVHKKERYIIRPSCSQNVSHDSIITCIRGLTSMYPDLQGYKMVQEKEYVIQESATRREIGRSSPWEASFLPGQRVIMSMLFNDSTSSTSSCPSCQTSTNEPQNCEIHWSVTSSSFPLPD